MLFQQVYHIEYFFSEDFMPLTQDVFAHIRELCHRAWQRNLLSGFNGNVSLRVDDGIAITCSGAAKGYLQEKDVCLLDYAGNVLDSFEKGAKPSSEASMHIQLYARRPDITAIVHCHPRHLLALELKLGGADKKTFLQIPVFEAEMLSSRMGFVDNFAPGTQELAESVGICGTTNDAIWMAQHGLTCVGKSSTEALGLAEELDHLAAVQLLGHK